MCGVGDAALYLLCVLSHLTGRKKLYLVILCLRNHMKNTAGFVGSNGILSSHHSFVESQNVYFKLALDIFAQKFIMELELFCYPFKQNEPFINQIAKVRKAKFIIPKLSSPITNDGPLCL